MGAVIEPEDSTGCAGRRSAPARTGPSGTATCTDRRVDRSAPDRAKVGGTAGGHVGSRPTRPVPSGPAHRSGTCPFVAVPQRGVPAERSLMSFDASVAHRAAVDPSSPVADVHPEGPAARRRRRPPRRAPRGRHPRRRPRPGLRRRHQGRRHRRPGRLPDEHVHQARPRATPRWPARTAPPSSRSTPRRPPGPASGRPSRAPTCSSTSATATASRTRTTPSLDPLQGERARPQPHARRRQHEDEVLRRVLRADRTSRWRRTRSSSSTTSATRPAAPSPGGRTRRSRWPRSASTTSAAASSGRARRSVFAETLGNASYVIRGLFASNKTMGQIFWSAPNRTGTYRSPSTRCGRPGTGWSWTRGAPASTTARSPATSR